MDADVLRHAPVQERGRRRFDQLLDAAAAVISDVGVDNATTNAIAARAGCSVGILYRFFPNKQALMQSLARRYLEEIEGLLHRQETDGIHLWPLQDAVDWIVRAIMDFHAERPAFQHVYRAMRAFEGAESMARLNQVTQVIDRLLELRMPDAPAGPRQVHAVTAVEAAQALVVYANTLPPGDRERITGETVTMLVRYLEPAYAPVAMVPAAEGTTE